VAGHVARIDGTRNTYKIVAHTGGRLGYGLDDRGSAVRVPAAAGNFSHHRVQTGFGIHSAS